MGIMGKRFVSDFSLEVSIRFTNPEFSNRDLEGGRASALLILAPGLSL
jgi:hypothetical protein